MIKLTSENGEPIWVNPARIEYFQSIGERTVWGKKEESADEGKSFRQPREVVALTHVFSTNSAINVRESPEQITEMIEMERIRTNGRA